MVHSQLAGMRCTKRKQKRCASDSDEGEERSGSAADSGSAQVKWVGAGSVAAGNTHYRACVVRGQRYEVGDTVRVRANVEGLREYVCVLEGMWRDPYGQAWMHNRWYYLPEETMYGRLPAHGKQEIFEGTLVDENYLETLAGHVSL